LHWQKDRAPGLRAVLLVWAVFGAVALAVLVTYARLPAGDLYNVDEEGLTGGAGRALVFLNYPVALVAIAVLVVVADRLRTPAASVLAVVAAVLCAAVAWPGVVEQSDLDGRLVNAVPAAGVAVAIVLTGVQPQLVAVHLGHHHGLDGTLLALTALALSRVVPQVSGRVRPFLGFYLALMLVYGLANALQDFWLEQLVKRGATSLELPNMLRPGLTPAWGGIVASALVIHLAAAHVGRFRPLRQGGTR
jgi:hypothetical protein